jgi:hypothetical protein
MTRAIATGSLVNAHATAMNHENSGALPMWF